MNIQWGVIVSAQSPITALNYHIIDIIIEHVPERVLKVRAQSQCWFNENCERAKRKK